MKRAYRSIDKLDFGLYKGYHLGTVYAFDPQYVEWCVNNVDDFTIIDFDFLKTVGVINPDLHWSYRMIGEPSAIEGIDCYDDFEELWVFYELYKKPKYTFDDSSVEIIRKNQKRFGMESRMYSPYEGEYYSE